MKGLIINQIIGIVCVVLAILFFASFGNARGNYNISSYAFYVFLFSIFFGALLLGRFYYVGLFFCIIPTAGLISMLGGFIFCLVFLTFTKNVFMCGIGWTYVLISSLLVSYIALLNYGGSSKASEKKEILISLFASAINFLIFVFFPKIL